MGLNIRGRSFLTLLDYTPQEIRYLLDLAKQFKAMKRSGVPHRWLQGKNIVLLFEKTSTRTRCSFEVAGMDLGMGVTYLGPGSSQMGKKESIPDTARVLGRMYDGIEYRGYSQQLVEELAKYSGVPVWNGLTDQFHPTQMLADLLTLEEKMARLEETGIDTCVILPFTREMAALTAGDFMRQVLCNALGVKVLVMGYDHRFGSEQSKDFGFYQKEGSACGIEVIRAEQYDNISSSRIRQLLQEGRLQEADSMLGYAYRFSGTVIEGDKRGRSLGFPTANLRVDAQKQLPGQGVYSARVMWNGRQFKGMMNIGSSPTFLTGGMRPPEVHLLHFDDNIYGETLLVEPVRRLRDEKTFTHINELISQLRHDAAEANKINL